MCELGSTVLVVSCRAIWESYVGLCSVCEMGSTVLGVSWGAIWESYMGLCSVCVKNGVLFWE